MKRLSLAGMQTDKEAILKKLAFFGALEIEDASPLLGQHTWLTAKPDTADTYKTESDIAKIEDAISALTPLATKKGLLSAKPNITKNDIESAMNGADDLLSRAAEVLEIVKKREAAPPIRTKLETQIAALRPWLSLDISLSHEGTNTVEVMYGFFPSVVDILPLGDRLAELACYYDVVFSDNSGDYCVVMVHKGAAEQCMDILREFSFTKLTFKDMDKPPAAIKSELEAEMANVDKELDNLTEELRTHVGLLPDLEKVYDALTVKLDMARVTEKLLKCDNVFFLTGYVPEVYSENLCTELAASYVVATELSEVDAEEDPPVLLKNNKIIQPYEMITELFSLPAYGRFDPNTIMAPFFFMFFGIMLADVGYGLMMMAIGFIALNKAKPAPGFVKNLFTLFIHGGLATTLAGFFFGSFFGDVVTVFSTTFLGKEINFRGVINPITEPITMLILCCSLGVLQILVGLGVKAYIMIKDGRALEALFDVGFWYVVFAGIGMFAAGMEAGVYVMGGGALGLILTQGREKKGIIGKLFSGILSLYSITGYMSDILSYSRLMALGIASGVISSVFNTMGALGGDGIVGIIMFVIVFIIGHTMNFAINMLGAYVHSSRLQYVEFFGKFYEGGGRPFKPLCLKPKYYNLTNEEEH